VKWSVESDIVDAEIVESDEPVEQLRRLRAATAARIDAMRRERDGIVDSAALSATDDEHDPEGATLAFEREQLAALMSEATARLRTIDAALLRVEQGTYGRCETCGSEIPAGRMSARPEATTCVHCASRH
jgi:DnaK suppressor protein